MTIKESRFGGPVLKGTGIGAALGGGFSGVNAYRKGPRKNESQKRFKARVLDSAAGGAWQGGYVGLNVGAAISSGRARSKNRRAGNYSGYRYSSGSGSGSGSRRRAPGSANNSGSKGFADVTSGVPANKKSRVRGTAAHARNPGPEGDSAREILKTMSKKYGFDADEVMKHAAFRAGVRSALYAWE